MVPAVMAVLCTKTFLPGPLALAFAISDFSGFLWTPLCLAADERLGPYDSRSSSAKIVAGLFGFVSGVVRICAHVSFRWTSDARDGAVPAPTGCALGAGW